VSPDETTTPPRAQQPAGAVAAAPEPPAARGGDSFAPEGEGRSGGPVLRLDEARRRRLRPWAVAGAALVVLVTGAVSLSYTSILGARQIEIEGETRLAERQIMGIAGVHVGTNVLHLDVAATEARLEAEPWILDASVATSLPGTITISVRERRPVMVVGSGADRRLAADDGTVLGRAPQRIDLPAVVTGSGGMPSEAAIRTAGTAAQAMAPALRARVDSIGVGTGGEVTLVVDGGIDVRYGSIVDVAAKGQALRAILDFAHERGETLLSVDLSSASAPTARFVGSAPVTVGPDPIARVADRAEDTEKSGRGTDDEGEGEPSP
jgi:cell division protein FtsQ